MFRLILLLFFSVTTFANPTFQIGTDPLIDISQTGTGLSLSDDGIKNVAIGFDFTFGSNTYDNVTVAMNGFLTFSSVTQFNSDVTRRRNYLSEQFPSAGYNNSIKPLHSDFIRRSSGNQSPYYQTFGNTSDTNQYFVVMWDNVSEYSNGRKSTFEVILYETTNDIKFLYDEVNIDQHSASIGLQYSMTDYVEYLWYDDTNSTSLELEEFSLTTAPVVDESFEALSSSCLEDSDISILCDVYDLNTNDLTEDFLDFTGIYTGYDDDFGSTGIDEDEIFYGISFTLHDEDEYFSENIEGVETDFSIITIDTLNTLEGERHELDLYHIDDSDITFSGDILLGGELDEFELDYFSIEELDELPIIIDIITHDEETHFAELEIIEEIFNDEEEIHEEEERQEEEEELHEESVEEVFEEDTIEEEIEEERTGQNRNIEIANATNAQGVRVANQSTSSSQQNNIQNNNQTISSNMSFESAGVSNQIAAEQNQTNTVLQSINIIPMDMGGGIANTQIAAVEITTVDLETQIASISTEVMSISEAQSLQESVIQSNLADIQEQSQEVQEETGEYSVDLQNSLIGIIGFVPNWNTYMTQLPDNQNWYQDNYLVENITLLDNNEALTSLIGYSSQQHSAMSSQSNNDFFRSYR